MLWSIRKRSSRMMIGSLPAGGVKVLFALVVVGIFFNPLKISALGSSRLAKTTLPAKGWLGAILTPAPQGAGVTVGAAFTFGVTVAHVKPSPRRVTPIGEVEGN